MKLGKQHIYDLPVNDILHLGVLAQQLQKEAESKGIVLPPPARLQIGEPSFRTPEHIRAAGVYAIEHEPLTYGPAAGWPWLRELIATKVVRINKYPVSPENIAITVGGTGAIQAALNATVGSGDDVLIPDPCWPYYYMQLASCGARPVLYSLDRENEWYPDIVQLERVVTPRTRLMIINTPGNPTGAVFPPSLVSDLLDFARSHDLYLLSDECYDEIVFEGSHTSPANLMTPEEFESGRVICVYTFSKTYAMTGWRIGYIATGKNLLKAINNVLEADHTNISTIVQRAASAALTGSQECVTHMRDTYRHRRDVAVGLLKDYGRYLYTPHGAFYLLIDISSPTDTAREYRQFTLDLLRASNVAVATGRSFGKVAEQFVRISLAASDEEIMRGVEEICKFADR